MSDDHDDSTIARQVRGVETLLEERGLVDPVELDRALQAFLARASPASGARVVARAWTDEGLPGRVSARTTATSVSPAMCGEPPMPDDE